MIQFIVELKQSIYHCKSNKNTVRTIMTQSAVTMVDPIKPNCKATKDVKMYIPADIPNSF